MVSLKWTLISKNNCIFVKVSHYHITDIKYHMYKYNTDDLTYKKKGIIEEINLIYNNNLKKLMFIIVISWIFFWQTTVFEYELTIGTRNCNNIYNKTVPVCLMVWLISSIPRTTTPMPICFCSIGILLSWVIVVSIKK